MSTYFPREIFDDVREKLLGDKESYTKFIGFMQSRLNAMEKEAQSLKAQNPSDSFFMLFEAQTKLNVNHLSIILMLIESTMANLTDTRALLEKIAQANLESGEKRDQEFKEIKEEIDDLAKTKPTIDWVQKWMDRESKTSPN